MVGIGAAACAVCCAGPVIAFLGGLSVAGVLGSVLVGVAGSVLAAVAGAAWLVLRRRRSCAVPSASTPVATPTVRRAAAPVLPLGAAVPDGTRR